MFPKKNVLRFVSKHIFSFVALRLNKFLLLVWVKTWGLGSEVDVSSSKTQTQTFSPKI